jgi:hypothetical protein
MSDELKLCPFCEQEETNQVDVVKIRSRFKCICVNCGTSSIDSITSEGAVENWNYRPREDALQAENERLRKALETYADYHNWEIQPSGYPDLWHGKDAGPDVAEKALEGNA